MPIRYKTLYNQSINQSLIKAYLAVMFVLMGLKICVEKSFNFVCSILSMNKFRQYTCTCIFVIRKPLKGMGIFNVKKMIRNSAIRSLGLEIRFRESLIRSLDLHGLQFVPAIYTMQPEGTSCVIEGTNYNSREQVV